MKLTHLLPPLVHRLLYRFAYRARRVWLKQTGQTVHGCSVLARDGQGRFLLVRHSYGAPVWAFPGGGIRSGETPLMAAVREFREELDCDLADLKRLTTLKERYLGGINTSHVFTALADGEPRPDRREILEARFFERDSFPADLSRTVAPRMLAYDAMQARAEAPAWHKLQQR